MKIHNDFTLYWRVFPSGKRVVYYYAYDENGLRQMGRSTGETNMTAARVKCNRLLKEGRLLPHRRDMQTFAEYSQGWWIWETCPYLKKRRKRHNITRGYADNYLGQMNKHLIPYFGKMKLDKITQEDIEKWFDHMAEKGYKNTYINSIFGTLRTMLGEAVIRKIIPASPAANMEKLVNDRKAIKIITPDEFKALFVNGWRRVWDNDRICYTANKLAALTGMRASEVLGLRGEYVFDDHIYKCAQFDAYGYRDTKTKDKHNIPLTPDMIAELKELTAVNGDGFLFSTNGGLEPISRKTLYTHFHRALLRIGLTSDEIKQRGLHLHAWRHFCNTELQKAGVTISKVQSVTGHKSDRMTEWYSHFDPNEFSEVRKAQEALLEPESAQKAVRNTDRAGRGTVIPFQGADTGEERKQA
jgi:integrase